jgi:hypothetical protein
MEQTQVDTCCDLGVKGSCACCDYSIFCNGKWSYGSSQGSNAESLK